MHRVRATQVQSRKPIYIDLDACPLIVRGSVTEKIEGKPERTFECTVLYFAATTPQGGGLVEYVDETPEELFGMTRIDCGHAVKAVPKISTPEGWKVMEG